MRKTIIIVLGLLSGAAAWSQDYPSQFSSQKLETTFQQYLSTNNAAGMGLFQPASGSKTQVEGFYGGGTDHLAQQGSPDYGFDFSTLRYDTLTDHLFMRGSFHYTLDQEKGRAWSDAMDPWFSIPFIYGSSVAKDYEKHGCGLAFDLYTVPLGGWISVGVRTQYEVADHSGLRDPRPRTQSLNWQAVPSVLLTWGPHHLGLDLGYGYAKEKLTGLTTIQSYPNLYYYKMSGLDHVDGAIGAYSGFKRQFYGGRFLGDLSYNYVSDRFRALLSAGMEYGRLDAYGDKKLSPGSYNYYLYQALANLQLQSGSLLHVLQLKGSLKDAGADQYLQELQAEKNPETGVTTETWVTLYTYENRYMLGQTSASLDYTLYGGCEGRDYVWSVQAGAAYEAFRKECFLPYSEFSARTLSFQLGGMLRLMEVRRHRLEAEASATGSLPMGVTQGLLFDSEYVTAVLEPDARYYRRQRLGGAASLTWTFPLNLGKAGMANGYLRLSGDYREALSAGDLWQLALTVGLFTF